MSTVTKTKFDIVRISGVAVGVGVTEIIQGGEYSEKICETLFDSGNNEKDAADSERWARTIVKALNKFYHQ